MPEEWIPSDEDKVALGKLRETVKRGSRRRMSVRLRSTNELGEEARNRGTFKKMLHQNSLHGRITFGTKELTGVVAPVA